MKANKIFLLKASEFMKEKFVTMKDLAKETGYSVVTVSRALNDYPNIKPKTKKEILKKAKELGYVKNRMAASLRNKKTKIIGVVITGSANPFYAEVIDGIEDVAKENGYHIILIDTLGNHKIEVKAIESLLQKRVEGLVIGPDYEHVDYLPFLQDNGFPFVILGRNFSNIDVYEVRTDEEKGGFLATRYLIENGHSRIAMINAPQFTFRRNTRYDGYIKALEEYGIELDHDLVEITDGISSEEGYNATRKLLENRHDFTAIFAYNDLIAFGALKALREENMNIPEDCSIVGFDNVRLSSSIIPAMTTINLDKYKMGKTAFELLVEQFTKNDNITTKKIFPPSLVIRESVKPL